jgi:TonB family protein
LDFGSYPLGFGSFSQRSKKYFRIKPCKSQLQRQTIGRQKYMRRILKKVLLPILLAFFCFSYGQTDSLNPVMEAQFPGGQSALMKYLRTNVADKVILSDNGNPTEKIIAKFFIDEKGNTSDAIILKSSKQPNLDDQLIEAIYAMPKWIPAENSKGQKVRQVITIPIYFCAR